MTSTVTVQRTSSARRVATASVNYIGEMKVRPRFHANDHSRDVLDLDARTVQIEDARMRTNRPSLAVEGFELVRHASTITDFRDSAAVAAQYPGEIRQLISLLSGAEAVVISSPGILRFGERSPDSGTLNNSRPARFIHIDAANNTAAAFAERSRPPEERRRVRRFAHYNIWRAITPPPQDVPLAVCDARTVAPQDLVVADAIFDHKGEPEWSFESLLVRYNPQHRWFWYSNMQPDEVLIFKTHDSAPDEPGQVPHTAFDDPSCPPDVPPRASIEIRAIAYWFEQD